MEINSILFCFIQIRSILSYFVHFLVGWHRSTDRHECIKCRLRYHYVTYLSSNLTKICIFLCSWAPSKMLHVQLNSSCTCNSEIGSHELVLTLYKYACSKDHNLLPSLCWGVEGWLWNRRYRSVSSFPLYILMESANRSTGADPRRPVGEPIYMYLLKKKRSKNQPATAILSKSREKYTCMCLTGR